MTLNSLSGNLAAKSSAAFSTAAGSVFALATLKASNSGWVLACGGRLGEHERRDRQNHAYDGYSLHEFSF